MMPTEKRPPVIPLEVEDTDETREPTGEDLRFNEDADSYELDPETNDREYDHPDPYDTAAPMGEDNNSTYDEQNPEASAEYRDKRIGLEGELQELDDVATHDQLTRMDNAEERLAETADDARGDLDEEGYPVLDDADGKGNPITRGPDDDDQDEDGDSNEAEMPPFEDPRRDDEEPIGDDPSRPIEPRDAPPVDERDPLGDKQIQSDDPTETTG